MNKILKSITALLIGVVLLGGSVAAGPDTKPEVVPGVAPEAMGGMPAPQCPGVKPFEFAPVSVCYLPERQIFVLVDSIDCAVDILQRNPGSEVLHKLFVDSVAEKIFLHRKDTAVRIGRFVTDVTKKRHDLKNIVRPRSVAVIDGKVVVLASSQKDSSFIAILDLDGICQNPGDSAKPIARAGFSSNANSFEFDPRVGELIVYGKNPVGYDLHVLHCGPGLESISEIAKVHYHVPKQSEIIKENDSFGGALTIVAICVVFIALVSICFIMKGYGSIIMKVQDRKKRKSAAKSGEELPAKTSEVAGEVYAAIAAAIYMYDQDMHDEEDTVITIQKVERAWTPWNAKFYNMNKYFNNRR